MSETVVMSSEDRPAVDPPKDRLAAAREQPTPRALCRVGSIVRSQTARNFWLASMAAARGFVAAKT